MTAVSRVPTWTTLNGAQGLLRARRLMERAMAFVMRQGVQSMRTAVTALTNVQKVVNTWKGSAASKTIDFLKQFNGFQGHGYGNAAPFNMAYRSCSARSGEA